MLIIIPAILLPILITLIVLFVKGAKPDDPSVAESNVKSPSPAKAACTIPLDKLLPKEAYSYNEGLRAVTTVNIPLTIGIYRINASFSDTASSPNLCWLTINCEVVIPDRHETVLLFAGDGTRIGSGLFGQFVLRDDGTVGTSVAFCRSDITAYYSSLKPGDDPSFKFVVEGATYEFQVPSSYIELAKKAAFDLGRPTQPREPDQPPVVSITQKPDWASSYGRDAFGQWADVSIKGIQQKMRLIPSGVFLRGSTDTPEEQPVDRIAIAGFWLGDSEVTQELWREVMGTNPSKVNIGPKFPVENMARSDCEEFLSKMNAMIPGVRAWFPTEDQWEYACRAGTKGPYSGELKEMAWHDSNSSKLTHEVKTKKPNAWGLYDMHGNVYEMCADVFRGNYLKPPPDKGYTYSVRGGAYYDVPYRCRSSSRAHDSCRGGWSGLGLRFTFSANP